MTNVLVTSAGRRVSLVRAFAEAASKYGGKVFAADADALAPALYIADGAARVPRLDDASYLSELVGVVEQWDIDILVPTIDTELSALAANAGRFSLAGCRAVISTESFIEITGDKWLTHQAFSGLGIACPRSWLPGDLPPDMPAELFIKPRSGSSSVDAFGVSRDDLRAAVDRVASPIIQERLIGTEITIDAMLDFEGRPLHYVPRTRLRTLAGESIQGVTLDDHQISNWIVDVLHASSSLGARGPVTLQAFLTSAGPILIEVNPRFGGGFPLGHAAGAKYPEWLVSLAIGHHVPPRLGVYERGLYMTRYNVEHFTREPLS